MTVMTVMTLHDDGDDRMTPHDDGDDIRVIMQRHQRYQCHQRYQHHQRHQPHFCSRTQYLLQDLFSTICRSFSISVGPSVSFRGAGTFSKIFSEPFVGPFQYLLQILFNTHRTFSVHLEELVLFLEYFQYLLQDLFDTFFGSFSILVGRTFLIPFLPFQYPLEELVLFQDSFSTFCRIFSVPFVAPFQYLQDLFSTLYRSWYSSRIFPVPFVGPIQYLLQVLFNICRTFLVSFIRTGTFSRIFSLPFVRRSIFSRTFSVSFVGSSTLFI